MCDDKDTVRVAQDAYFTELSLKLRKMAQDALDDSTHDKPGLGLSLTEYKKNMMDAIRFRVGAHLCEQFLYGSIGLDEICSGMYLERLEEFFIKIPHISKEILLNYGLIADDDTDDDDDDDDEDEDSSFGGRKEEEETKEDEEDEKDKEYIFSYACCGGGGSNVTVINDWCPKCF